MEEQRDTMGMLDLMVVPAFCVINETVVRANAPAQGLMIAPGMGIQDLFLTGAEEYRGFSGGCLYLALNIGGVTRGATVCRTGDADVFVLESAMQNEPLTALALAARELRQPLSNVMLSAEKLYNPAQSEEAARLNKGLYQMLRLLGNMADAGELSANYREETVNICAVIREIFEKATTLLQQTGISLTYESKDDHIYCLADRQQLERAILNMLSNAIKFTPAGGHIAASLCRTGRMLRLSVQDSGCGIAEELLPTVFSRYLRQPCVEDGRFGMGLGMVLIRSAATRHGGTVLLDKPEGGGTRITLTLNIRQSTANILNSPKLFTDYSGERDHALVEFSQILPPEFYRCE